MEVHFLFVRKLFCLSSYANHLFDFDVPSIGIRVEPLWFYFRTTISSPNFTIMHLLHPSKCCLVCTTQRSNPNVASFAPPKDPTHTLESPQLHFQIHSSTTSSSIYASPSSAHPQHYLKIHFYLITYNSLQATTFLYDSLGLYTSPSLVASIPLLALHQQCRRLIFYSHDQQSCRR